MDITIRIGGEAGQGLRFIGSVLARIFSRIGLHVFSHQDYMSRVRGGHNFYQIRVADHPVRVSKSWVDILLALDENTILVHRGDLGPAGVIIHDAARTGQQPGEPFFLHMPFREMTEKAGVTELMANAAAVGAILGGLGLGLDLFPETVRGFLGNQGEGVIASNLAVASAGWEYAHRLVWPASLKVPPGERPGLMLLNGSQAIGFGALVSGCRFFAAYPMPSAINIMIYLAAKAEEYKIVVEQAEDEIAAINMALGASFGGVRAMTATSSGGFALMAEGVSLAGMTELPLVIVEVQRPGPATGLPTRTEQGDLLFGVHCGHGEFSKVLFTPGSPAQAIALTNKAFDLAEKYQVPVIIQSDQFLADAEWTYEKIAASSLVYNDYRDRAAAGAEEEYQRFAVTATGVSPLAVPGFSARLVVVDGDEHDAAGHISEDGVTRRMMVAKRVLRKAPLLQEEIAPPEYYGHENPRLLLVGYGSTYGIMREAVDELGTEVASALLHFSEIWPFPVSENFDFPARMARAELAVCVENNATGQFARLVRGETGFQFELSVRKYDGRPFLLEPFLGEVNELLRRV
jgi:2-oxoglutarate ferredoxin oxidoreductase subunit alpha